MSPNYLTSYYYILTLVWVALIFVNYQILYFYFRSDKKLKDQVYCSIYDRF